MDLNFILIGDNNFREFLIRNVRQIIRLYPSAKIWLYELTDKNIPFMKGLFPASNVNHLVWDKSVRADPPGISSLCGYLINDKTNKTFTDTVRLLIKKFILFDPMLWKSEQQKLDEWKAKERILIQKPFCMLDCAKRIKGKLVFLDADALLLSSIDRILEEDFNIGVTLRRPNEICLKKNKCAALNSGVIFFNSAESKTIYFLEKWIERMNCTHELLIEQTALTRMIENFDRKVFESYGSTVLFRNDKGDFINVRVLPCDEYNYNWIEMGVDYDSVKIAHFKGERHNKKGLKQVDSVLKIANRRCSSK